MVNNKWNKKYTKESHNCYSYFLNKTSKKAKRHCKKVLKKGKKRWEVTIGKKTNQKLKQKKKDTAY